MSDSLGVGLVEGVGLAEGLSLLAKPHPCVQKLLPDVPKLYDGEHFKV